MLKIDNVFNPKVTANIIDLGTGTRDLTQEGLGALRLDQTIKSNPEYEKLLKLKQKYPDKFPTADESLTMTREEALKKYPPSRLDDLDLPEGVDPRDTILPSSLMGRIEGQMNKIKGTSSKLDDAMKEYENIYKSADDLDLPPPGSRGGPDDIAAPVQQYTNEIDALETMTKNRAGNEFITAYVDDIYKNAGVTASVDVPKKRAAARAFLNSMLKKETDLLPPGKGGTLESVVSEADYKFITEGGGGALGDPLVLVKKYFGDEIARRLPLDTRTEVIDTFVDNVRFTKDRAGFRTDDPRFNPDDLPDFATGGRVGFMAGGIGRFTKAEVLIQRLLNTIKESKDKTDDLSVYVNETFPGFIKEIKANPKLAENEQVWKTLGLDLPKDQKLVVHSDDTVDFFRQTEGPQNIAKVEAFMAKHPFLSREDALRIMKMEPEDRVLEITRLEILNRRTKNAHGGLAKILEV